jgi:hypothetical protein
VVKGSLPIPEGKQVVEITAKEDVKIRAFVDGQTMDVDTLSPATHSYSFETNAEFFCLFKKGSSDARGHLGFVVVIGFRNVFHKPPWKESCESKFRKHNQITAG